MEKGLIIIGYQGIGKSSCAGRNECIDLESGNFWVNGNRSEDWYIPYCQTAVDLASQGYTVFTSSHEVVRKQFASMPSKPNVKIVVFCPPIEWEELWVFRLKLRFEHTQLEKDYKALRNAEERYRENIAELCNSGFAVYHPKYIDYDLMAYVNAIRCGMKPNDFVFSRTSQGN